MPIILFLLVLAVLVLVHEFGHFIVAKMSGIRVDEFGLGFPPKLYGKKFGGTEYTINAIPFGGYVKIFGEDPIGDEDALRALAVSNGTSSQDIRISSFQYKSKWIQAAVLVAGVTFNIIFAWLLISLGFMIGLPSYEGQSSFGKTADFHLVVTEVLANSPAQKAGLKSGDEIVSVFAGGDILTSSSLSPEDVQHLIVESNTKNIDFTIVRGKNSPQTISIEPNETVVEGRRAIGIAMDSIGTLKLPVHLGLIEGARTTGLLIKGVTVGLADFFWKIFTFKSDFSQVSGPIGIASAVGDAQSLGFVYLLSLVALISINLAVINLLPFPALDGGRLLFVVIEAIIRQPISPTFVRRANVTGFSLLILLMLIVTAHDIFNLF